MYDKSYVVPEESQVWINKHYVSPFNKTCMPNFTTETPYLIEQVELEHEADIGFVGLQIWWYNWSTDWLPCWKILYDGTTNCKRK